VLKKTIWVSFQRIIELFTQKFVTKLSKIWVWDPRSGISKKPIPDQDPGPGVKKAPDPGSGSATLDSDDLKPMRIHNTASLVYQEVLHTGDSDEPLVILTLLDSLASFPNTFLQLFASYGLATA
jgi:hypothetical protein